MVGDHRTTRRALLAATGSATAALAGCSATGSPDRATRTVTRRLDVDSETAVELDNFNGPVTVEGVDGDQLEVEADVSGVADDVEETTLSATRNGDTLLVETTRQESSPPSLFDSTDVSVTLTVRCPTSVSVERVDGVNGDIDVRNVGGPVSLVTTDGDVTAVDVRSLGDVSTDRGHVDVDVTAIEGDVSVEATYGDVTANLAASLDAEVTATVVRGTVEVDDALGLRPTEDGVAGTLGDGSNELAFEATSGDITLSGTSS